MLALLRIETVRGLGIRLPGTHVPPGRIATLVAAQNRIALARAWGGGDVGRRHAFRGAGRKNPENSC